MPPGLGTVTYSEKRKLITNYKDFFIPVLLYNNSSGTVLSVALYFFAKHLPVFTYINITFWGFSYHIYISTYAASMYTCPGCLADKFERLIQAIVNKILFKGTLIPLDIVAV